MGDSFSKGGEYFSVFMAVYEFHKKYSRAFNRSSCISDDVWNAVSDDLGQFNTLFGRALAVAVLDELDREAKKINGGTNEYSKQRGLYGK